MATNTLPDLPSVALRGPFWTAEADVVQLADPAENWAFRTLFLTTTPRAWGKEKAVFLPGTLLALVWVRSVTLKPARGDTPAYLWRRATASQPPVKPTPDQVRSLLASGELALLLAQPDPAGWIEKDKKNPMGEKPRFAALQVLAGDISLDRLQPQGGAREKVYAAAGLAPAQPGERAGAAKLVGQMSVHASGLSLFGQVPLPWEAAPVAAPFLLARRIPDAAEPSYRLAIEEERLTDAERAALVEAWARLSRYVNPAHPLSGTVETAPAWVTLEVANPQSIPRLHWELPRWVENPGALPPRFARGEITLLIADQQPYEDAPAPTSLARAVPDAISITRAGSGLRVEVSLGPDAAAGGTLSYHAERGGATEWTESFTLSGAPLAFSPVETPRRVRDAQALPVPEWVPGDDAAPVEPAVVWGFVPLADGWAQLPVPNLTEQIYLDAELAEPPPEPEAVLQGAVAFGNDKPGTTEAQEAEQPWSLTLTNARGFRGTWTLDGDGAGFRLARVELALRTPDLVLNGLFWLSTEAPTTADALPGLDDWVAGLTPVSLNTVRPGGELFPPVVTTPVDSLTFALRRTGGFPSAALGDWAMTYAADAATFAALVGKRVLPADAFARHRPLVWRRHPTLPMVQALPLTQSQTPPTHPARSRQLAPFQLGVTSGDRPLPDGWRFGVAGGGGAAEWPWLLGEAGAAAEWSALADLPLAALSLPGLVLDPAADGEATGVGADAGLGLALQYRYDLPYTDEPNALAQLPKVPRAPTVTPQLGGAEAPPQPLTRETLAEHWKRLSERASLAGVDAATAFRREGQTTVVRNLVEPLPWPVTASVDADAYPGALTLDNAGGASAPLALSGEAALGGVSGRFAQAGGDLRRLADGDASADAFEIVAGSMAAARAADGSFRDQRGLSRSASAISAGLVRTPVSLDATDYELTSALEAVDLHAAEDDAWRFWFRDLPARHGEFARTSVLSSPELDVNDPHAADREHNVLNGYEWRLETNDDGFVSLFGFHFYPLTLDLVRVDGEGVLRVEIAGRLQLPLVGGGELPDFTNAVRVAFVRDGQGRLALDSVTLAEEGTAEWPLAVAAGEASDAPRLEWTGIEIGEDGASLVVKGGRLRFFLFDAEWSVPLSDLVFDRAGTVVEHDYQVEGGGEDEALSPRTLSLRVDPAGLFHAVSLLLDVKLGKAGVAAPSALTTASAGVTATRAAAATKAKQWRRVTGTASSPVAPSTATRSVGAEKLDRETFRAAVRFHLLGGAAAADWEEGTLFDDLDLPATWDGEVPNRSLSFADGALQFTWQRAGEPGKAPALQLLPGMHVGSNEAPGFAALSFTVNEAGDVPALTLASAFVETLLHCRWGAFLQEPLLDGADPLRRVFGSSAGDVAFGYTAQKVGGAWVEGLLLNGFVEIKDLVSFPAALSVADVAGKRTLTLPPARGREPLAHTRHTLRVLLNQHRIPADVLTAGEGNLLFDLKEGRAWQFLAVAEHQLVEVTPSATLDAVTVAHDRRWTAVQEIRIARPASFKRFLASSADVRTLDPVDGIDAIGAAHGGWLGAGMRTRLAGGTAPELDRLPAGTLVVEAGALHWVRQQPVATSAATTLQFLPNGSQLAVLSGPADYAPSDPADPQWLLLTTPFLGRLQDQANDGVPASPANASPLQVDPVLLIHRARTASSTAALPDLALALATWGDAAAVRIAVSGLDAALGRTWARLDPLSLEENWFRLQNPREEPRVTSLQSVLAALPANPARLSRATALARAFQAERAAYPPAQSTGDLPSPDLVSETLVWRPDALLGLQGVSDRAATASPPYGWHLTGFLLATSALAKRDAGTANARRTYPAATVLPTRHLTDRAPLALAVSPYLGVDLRPALGEFHARLVFGELLCLNGATGTLLPVASTVWELKPGGLTRGNVAALAQDWARESHRRLAPESPVAVLRFREVNERVSPATADEAVLTTTYTFESARDLERPVKLSRRVFRIRSDVRRLRFRDGRFGGREVPTALRPFELAPPQTVGVQPIRLTERPKEEAGMEWPWGMSGLGFSVRYTEGGRPVIGSAGEADASALTLWWQAPQHRLQFRSPARAEGPTAGLPPFFRAPSIRALLPVVPDAPLPKVDAGALVGVGTAVERWQPVLPGALRYLLLGARAGAMLAVRHQLLRQSGLDVTQAGKTSGEALTSGSVPAQHRVPRPVPLPANQPGREDAALRTWASWFDPTSDLLATTAPADEGFFAAGGGQAARRIRLALATPAFGAVGAGWDGTLAFDVRFGDDADRVSEWNVRLEIVESDTVFIYGPPQEVDGGRLRFALSAVDAETFAARVAARQPGETLPVRARVAPKTAALGFFQTLTFALRVAEGAAVPLPLEPRFAHFEDPEYNRRLASSAAHASGVVKTVETPQGQAPRTVLRTATLAADRRQYNPDSVLSARYDWEDEWATGVARLTVRRIDAAGVVLALDPAAENVLPGQLVQFSLAGLTARGLPVRLNAGDALQLELRVEAQDRVQEAASVFLTLDVVAEPVQPVPEAAYALLRRGGEGVECVRFAWAPEPARVELVNPADLRAQVVRRRAVFHWTDTLRRAALADYAVQKVAQNGSTHIPAFR